MLGPFTQMILRALAALVTVKQVQQQPLRGLLFSLF